VNPLPSSQLSPASIDRFDSDKSCRVLVFTSPKAGSGASRDQVPLVLRRLEDEGIACEKILAIDDLRDRLTTSSPSESIVVVAAGGDGTLSLAASVAQQCTESNVERTPIVPMPLGTENLLARHFGHQADAEAVLRTIRRGACYRLDMGTANGRPFLIMATCGFDAEVVRGMHLTRRGHIRRFSYAGPILRAMRKYNFPAIRIQVDAGEAIECRWAMVFNLPRYGGGLNIEPGAAGDDGMLDVIAFRRGSIPSGLKYITGIWTRRHLGFADVVRRRGREIEITSDDRVPFQLDGDYAGRLPLKIETNPGQVLLLLPPANP
jgi:diacylglycerol kinase family enzyme